MSAPESKFCLLLSTFFGYDDLEKWLNIDQDYNDLERLLKGGQSLKINRVPNGWSMTLKNFTSCSGVGRTRKGSGGLRK